MPVDMVDTQAAESVNLSRTSEVQGPRSLQMLLVLLRGWFHIAMITLAFFVLGIIIAFSLTVNYTSTATILPPQAPQSTASALIGQIGSLAGLGAAGAGGLLKNPGDIYVAMLQSRTITDQIIDRFQLQAMWKQKKLADTRKALSKRAQFEAAKDGLIIISVKDPSPNLASDIANAYVAALYKMNSALATTEAGQRRVFFDEQVQAEKSALSDAEEDLRKTQEKTGILELSGQSAMAIRTVAETGAELRAREVELQSLRAYETDENPDVTKLKAQISTLRQQLAAQENDQQNMLPGDTQVPAGRVPAQGLEYARKLREVKYRQALFDLLTRQFQAARIDEAKSAPIIQVVDRAVPSDKKSGPPRMLIVLGAGIIGFCLACFWTFCKGAFERMRENSSSAALLHQMRAILHHRL